MLTVRHPPAASTTWPFSLLRTSPLSWLWSVYLPRLFRCSNSLCLGSAMIDNILSSRSWHDLDLCRSFHVFHHFFHETRCLIFLFFPLKKSFQLVTKLIPVPFFSLFICSCFFKHIAQVGFSFCTFSAALCPRDFLLSAVRRALCSPQRPQSTFLQVSR